MKFRSLFNIPTHDKTKAINNIIEDSSLKYEYIVLNIIAVIVAVLWIYQNSIPLITASMIIAPLILPIVGTALWITLRNTKLIFASLRNLWINTGAIVVAWALITLLLRRIGEFPNEWYLGNEIIYYLTGMTGVVSWIAAAFMLSNERLSDGIAWVAIAVALVPPLAVSIIHLSLFQWSEFFQSFGVYLTTIVTVIVGAASVFYLMNFNMNKKDVDKMVDDEENKNE